MEKREELLSELNNIVKGPNGNLKLRFTLNAIAGVVPMVGGAIAGASSVWGEKEQQKVNEKILEFLEKSDIDLSRVLDVLFAQLRDVTKSNLSEIIGEYLGVKLPEKYDERGICLNTILHGETLREFKPYEEKGWITIKQTYNMVTMGCNNMSEMVLEDKKRPYGLGYGYLICINKSFYE